MQMEEYGKPFIALIDTTAGNQPKFDGRHLLLEGHRGKLQAALKQVVELGGQRALLAVGAAD